MPTAAANVGQGAIGVAGLTAQPRRRDRWTQAEIWGGAHFSAWAGDRHRLSAYSELVEAHGAADPAPPVTVSSMPVQLRAHQPSYSIPPSRTLRPIASAWP